ncbi:hypothetical protein D3C72_1791670 [compost metagenome]
MLGHRVELGDFEVVRAFVAGKVVLGRIDQAGLERGVDLAHRHRRGVAAHGFHHGDGQVGLLHADLQALGVGQRLDGLVARVHGARATVVPGQPHEAGALARAQDLIADLAVQHLVQVVLGSEQEGQRGHARGLADVVHGGA